MARVKTGYETYSSIELHSLFTADGWRGLDAEHRLFACQEVENRLAVVRGTESRRVLGVPMEGATFGCQYGDTIEINSYLLSGNAFHTTYTDFEGNQQVRVTEVQSPGWEVFDTVNHEDMHGAWEDRGIMPDTYIEYDSDPDLYRIQGCERVAFEVGEQNTLNAIREVSQASGIIDPDGRVYITNHSSNEYQESVDRAASNYNDPDIENTLDAFISNTDEGIELANPSDSYRAISDLYDQQCYDDFYETAAGVAHGSDRASQMQQSETIARGVDNSIGTETILSEETIRSASVLEDGSALDSEQIEETQTANMIGQNDGSEIIEADGGRAQVSSYDQGSDGQGSDGAGISVGTDVNYGGGSSYGSGGE